MIVGTPAEPAPRQPSSLRTALFWALVAPLVLGFLGPVWWGFDLLANFRPHLGFLLLLVAMLSAIAIVRIIVVA